MQGKQKIIDDIIDSAKKTAANVIAEAERESNASVEKLRQETEAQKADGLAAAERAANAAYAGQVKLAELEAGKVLLRAKQECVGEVYDSVKSRILSAPDAEYLGLLQKLIAENCEDGDEVIAAAADAKRVTAEWVKSVSHAVGKKLTLSKTRGDFDGGVILRNAVCDRDLSVDEIIADLRERTVFSVVEKLGL